MVDGKLDIETVMKEFTSYIYVVITNKCHDLTREDIEEIISDVFLNLWNSQKKLDINKNLSPYVAAIAKNLVSKKIRGKKKLENIEDFEEKLISQENIELIFETEEKNEVLIQELDKLKEEDKKIFMMFYYEERKIREIASILNITESKIKSKLSRFRKKINKVLKEG